MWIVQAPIHCCLTNPKEGVNNRLNAGNFTKSAMNIMQHDMFPVSMGKMKNQGIIHDLNIDMSNSMLVATGCRLQQVRGATIVDLSCNSGGRHTDAGLNQVEGRGSRVEAHRTGGGNVRKSE
ncbi:MAG TPA: hypothetical protein VMJ11_24800 [Paraburkholderia sp.]|uniref:hypothetical protein n=1 Tax=Paraburkholderia sp. TaxID=1926495 RepID=UPI002C165EDF|nr:hypothetical protein [Paraburkholderia sp.]HTR09817.1 hypothetical protein [Paraburkholderia sp.]